MQERGSSTGSRRWFFSSTIEPHSASAPCSMTHDLPTDVHEVTGVDGVRVCVTKLCARAPAPRRSRLRAADHAPELGSRLGDARALAVRSGAPIFAADDVIAESAITFQHEGNTTKKSYSDLRIFSIT